MTGRDDLSQQRLDRYMTGKRAVGYLCNYVPVEILHAAGFNPVFIQGDDTPSPGVNSHLQSYCCHVVKQALGLALDTNLSDVEGVVFAHSCDAMQSLADIWRFNFSEKFTLVFNMPAKLNGEPAFQYLKNELLHFIDQLEHITGQKIESENLRRSCEQYNEYRTLLRRCSQMQMGPNRLSNFTFQNMLNRLSMLPIDEAIQCLQGIISEQEAESKHGKRTDTKLIISASRHTDTQFFKLLDECNVAIVGFDSCNGSRMWDQNVDDLENPIDGIARRLLKRPTCPCKLSVSFNRSEYLIQMAKEAEANGVIFYLYKYCDPHFSDIPQLKNSLAEAGIRCLVLEVEKPGMNLPQFRSRIQAFQEMLADD